jgi:putative membrane protein
VHHEHAPAAGESTGWHWAVTLGLGVAGVVLYVAAAALAQRRLQRPWHLARAMSWTVGVVLVAAAVSPPLSAFAHQQPTGHMVQHLLLGMFAPLALVLAAPVILVLGAFSTPVRRRIGAVLSNPVMHVLAHPFTAATLNVGTLYLLYLTPLYAAAMGSPLLHALVNIHFVLAGYLFAWAIAGPDPAPRRPVMLTRLVALFLATAAHGYLAKLLYASAAVVPPGAGHTLAQNEQAAQWMYYGGDIAELLLAVALFAAWYRGRVPTGRGRSVSAPGSTPAARRSGLLSESSAPAH